jgi:hypothetical protein
MMTFDDAIGIQAEAVGTPCIDGTALSPADVQRAAQRVEVERETMRRAIYAVAGHANNAQECRNLFDMIGLDRASVVAAREASGRP